MPMEAEPKRHVQGSNHPPPDRTLFFWESVTESRPYDRTRSNRTKTRGLETWLLTILLWVKSLQPRLLRYEPHQY